MVIIKMEVLSYFYTRREHRKQLLKKVSVIALDQFNEMRIRIGDLSEKFFFSV